MLVAALVATAGPAAALAAAAAPAAPIPGARYTGTGADGASVTFTVSSSGTLVDSYRIQGQTSSGCQFLGNGDLGVWMGAPIATNAFSYQLYSNIYFSGSFTGPQSAAGTFRFYDAASPTSPACDTGTVSWTATTTATPPSGGGNGGAGNGNGNGNTGKKPHFATSVRFRKLSAKADGGQLRSSSVACRANRQVILWRGRKRLGATKSKAGGKFSFRRSAKVRGRKVRASVTARTVGAGICQAGSSTLIAG